MTKLVHPEYIAINMQHNSLFSIKTWKPISGKSGIVELCLNFVDPGLYDDDFYTYVHQFLAKTLVPSNGTRTLYLDADNFVAHDHGSDKNLMVGGLKSFTGGTDRLVFRATYQQDDEELADLLQDILPLLANHKITPGGNILFDIVYYTRK